LTCTINRASIFVVSEPTDITLTVGRAPDGMPTLDVTNADSIPAHLREEFDDVIDVLRRDIVSARMASRLAKNSGPFLRATRRATESVALWAAERVHGLDPARVREAMKAGSD
jgi:hypothetical protein